MDEKCISHDGFEIRLNNVEKDIKNVEKTRWQNRYSC